MNQDEFRFIVAKNLVFYRKKNNYTQLQLAEATNYSDKAISKWERGESLPDVFVLKQLADFYGVTLNDLMAEERPVKVPMSRRTRLIIILITFASIWALATLVFSVLWIFAPAVEFSSYYWLAFIYAIPTSFLVSMILSQIWFHETPLPLLCATVFLWTAGVSLHLSIGLVSPNAWMIYVVAGAVQVVIFFVFWLVNVRQQRQMSIFAWIKSIFVDYIINPIRKRRKK